MRENWYNISIFLKGDLTFIWKTDPQREEKKELFHQLAHSPKGHDGWD